jgi:predicted CoA-binding protein
LIITYSDKFLKNILQETKSIAVVGASSKTHRDSFKVMETLIKNGYIVYPVNPYEVENKILGMQCYPDLKSIDEEVDMVDIFRSLDAVLEITHESISINAKTIWMQLDIVHPEAEELAQKAGIKVVMDRCPKIELSKSYWTSK